MYVGQGRVGGGIGRHSGCLEHGRAEDAVAGSVGKGAAAGKVAGAKAAVQNRSGRGAETTVSSKSGSSDSGISGSCWSGRIIVASSVNIPPKT